MYVYVLEVMCLMSDMTALFAVSEWMCPTDYVQCFGYWNISVVFIMSVMSAISTWSVGVCLEDVSAMSTISLWVCPTYYV